MCIPHHLFYLLQQTFQVKKGKRVCIRMSSVCYWYVLACHSYVTGMYSYVIRLSFVCTRMSSICHSYVVLPYTKKER